MKFYLKRILASTVLASLALASTSSMAQTYVSESAVTGEQVSGLALPVASGAGTYWSGLLDITVSLTQGGAGSSFQAFCFDPFQYSDSAASNYAVSSGLSSLASTPATWVSNLYSKYYATSTGDATNAAAFQIALWDLAKDDGVLSSGQVHTTSATDPTVANLASSMMTAAKAGAGATQYSLNLYTSATAQDYLVASVTAVPEPETYAMMFAGLGLMGFTVRRRLRV